MDLRLSIIDVIIIYLSRSQKKKKKLLKFIRHARSPHCGGHYSCSKCEFLMQVRLYRKKKKMTIL